MKLLADLHTHSSFSRFGHGKNTIEEMAIAANEIGLVEVAITDHGFAHFFKTSKAKIAMERKIINEINSWSKTKVLLGVEADIISEDGTIDIDNETLSMLDVLLVGYHRMIFTNFANFFGKTKKTEDAKKKCTRAFINAINKYPVTMVVHLDSILTTDLYEIGKACKERGTIVEINDRHTNWNEKQMEDLIASGCMFALSSDAHKRENVGSVERAKEFITKYNIPSERVVNVEFSESEKSEADREFSAYRSVYEQLAKQKREQEEAIDRREKTEITGKLSDEMENALRQIAHERGETYTEYKRPTVEQAYINDLNDENERLIAQAKEYIRQHSIKEIEDENKNIESVDGDSELEGYKFDDDHPLLKNIDKFEDKYQPLSDIVEPEKPEVKVVSSDKSPYEQLKSSEIVYEKNGEEFKKLFKEKNNVPESETINPKKDEPPKQEFKKVDPENFMDSITQTRLANGIPQKVEEKKEQPKVVQKKKGKMGAFIVVDNLIDDSNK